MKKLLFNVSFLILVFISLWLSSLAFVMLIVFSYSDHILSWIPYILLGGWVPGKLYGLNLFHSILCIAISFGLIDFFDKKFSVFDRPRKVILLFISFVFLFEGVSNYFFKTGQGIDDTQLPQLAIIQISFLVGILIKTFNPNAKME